MEGASEGEKKKPPKGSSNNGGGENKMKRKMKTPSQLELLEKTYAVDAYPSETLRQELSAKLGLTDRQLQMWFCHRRLKDRKDAPAKRLRKDVSASRLGLGETMDGETGNEPGLGSGSGSSPPVKRKVASRQLATTVSRAGADVAVVKRYYEAPKLTSESRAIAFVEAQLGEPLREDGPILGMEFDLLPVGAFGAQIAVRVHQKQAGKPHDGYEHHLAKSSKVATRPLHEYQFLSDAYERGDPSRIYSSPHDGPRVRGLSLSAAGSYIHGKEQVPAGPGFQVQGSSSRSSKHGRQAHVANAAAGGYDSVPHRNSFANAEVDIQVRSQSVVGLEDPLGFGERLISQEDDASILAQKHKSEEARIAREVEAHERRIRKELEKQDILRRKREEQMRKDMERHDRERRKEEERLMREKQREEERFIREQRRELERREKFLLKENLRAEKMKQKEELRREKEAARLKAANERATARRIAKESMELIEDERLELMELAASSKGLPSTISVDSETYQNLELFRDMLCKFPPEAVQQRRPFVIQPWADSEENIGNLLMVWRFLNTFMDALELWPFTLDELVQAFHDYDPRLLGEIHVALLRLIIKDIEDVARTPSGLGANQNGSANPGGGHPQIVEGAYAWGFDICTWKRHLNPLTWPEILRQIALSAGFGPQLKKKGPEQGHYREDKEGYDGEDIITALRSGAAAESAAAVMQEKCSSHPRKSRHRLTPGTVKFAAYHVLSVEGSKGITILELAEKIQKSGLRDLTTSKTPEASISAALSRDSNLFERTAPSTYCLRAAYRKDPTDAEIILAAAREKIHIFENGFSDFEEAEKDAEQADDVERDDNSDCDEEDHDVYDIGMNQSKDGTLFTEMRVVKTLSCSENKENKNICKEVGEIPQSMSGYYESGNSLFSEGKKEIKHSGATSDHSIDVGRNSNISSNAALEDAETVETNHGEPWVRGLTEGEYSDLTVEERLNALIALIGVAIEGNSVRVVLEERLEAATAVKKQMWAEAQLDKRRVKEEYTTKSQYLPYVGIKTDPNITNSAVEGIETPFDENKCNEPSPNPSMKQEALIDFNGVQNDLNCMHEEMNMLGQEFSVGPDISQQHLYAAAAEKSRTELKSYIGQKAEEMYVYRSLPLGQDRRRNRYWLFATSTSKNDPGSGRIFFESQGGCWRLIDSEEAFETLLASLDTRGTRESHLHSMLQKIEVLFKEAVRRNLKCKSHLNKTDGTLKIEASQMDYGPNRSLGIENFGTSVCGLHSDTVDLSSSFTIELGRSETERVGALKRYHDFQKWMWKECFNPSTLSAIKYGKKRCSELLITCDFCFETYSKDNHCPVCHRMFANFSTNILFSDHVTQCEEKQKMGLVSDFRVSDSSLPLRIRMLKAQLTLTEVSVPSEALQILWADDYRNSWGLKLQSSVSAEDLLQVLTLLEDAIKRDCLSSNFETTRELLSSSSGYAVDDFPFGSVPILPWVPHTTAAVALRLLELDASITYMLEQKFESQKDKEAGEFIKVPSKLIKDTQEVNAALTPERTDYQQENWHDMASGHISSGRGQGGRERGLGRTRGGGRLPRGSSGLRIESVRGSAGQRDKIGKGMGRKIQSRGRGRKRGGRTVRNGQRVTSERRVVNKETGSFGQFGNKIIIPKHSTFAESPRSLGIGERGWEENTRRMDIDEERNFNINSEEEASEDSDECGQGIGDEYGGRQTDYSGGMFSGRSQDLMEESIGEEDEEDGNGDDYEEVYVEREDVDMEDRYMDVERHRSRIEEDEEDEDNVVADEGLSSYSDDSN